MLFNFYTLSTLLTFLASTQAAALPLTNCAVRYETVTATQFVSLDARGEAVPVKSSTSSTKATTSSKATTSTKASTSNKVTSTVQVFTARPTLIRTLHSSARANAVTSSSIKTSSTAVKTSSSSIKTSSSSIKTSSSSVKTSSSSKASSTTTHASTGVSSGLGVPKTSSSFSTLLTRTTSKTSSSSSAAAQATTSSSVKTSSTVHTTSSTKASSTSTRPTTSSTSTRPTTSSTSTRPTTSSTSTRPTTSSTSTRPTTSSTRTTSSTSPATASPAFNFQQTYLDRQNHFRSLHQNTPSLSWDAGVAAVAQGYADDYTCNGILVHSGNSYNGQALGENLAYGFDFRSAAAVDAWYREINQYDYSNPQFSESTGHFTQLVWESTTRVGCGYKYCGTTYGYYVICNYQPAGNVIYAGNDRWQFFRRNVQPLIE